MSDSVYGVSNICNDFLSLFYEKYAKTTYARKNLKTNQLHFTEIILIR